jgi:VanZ family protein
VFYAKAWLPIIAWMVIIFSASSDQGSMQHSSRIIEPLLLWFFPKLDPSIIHSIVMAARKGAHMTEYAILAGLLWRAFSPRNRNWGWEWRPAWLALLIVILYAATDEFHQTFVPTREGSVVDVLIDTVGAAIGLLVVRWLFHLRGQRWQPSPATPGTNRRPPKPV